MSENTSSITTVKPRFKLWSKRTEADEVTPKCTYKPFPSWVYGVLLSLIHI